MTEKEAKDFLDLTYTTIKNRYEKSDSFAKTVLITGGEVIDKDSVTNKYRIKLNPYDIVDDEKGIDNSIWCFPIANQTFNTGDLVFLIYWGDLTNAKILCLNK